MLNDETEKKIPIKKIDKKNQVNWVNPSNQLHEL